MPIHILKLVARREVARGTHVFDFTKPDGFTFKPGQYGGFTLINPSETDAGGITRRFSLLNAPGDEYISIATRVQSSAYKRVLNSFTIGSEIKFAGPTGGFVLHADEAIPAVLIAGGIGITPFYSMIRDGTLRQSARQLYLFYGNQSATDAAFLPELNAIKKNNSHFSLVATLNKPHTGWEGETGYITHTMIKKHFPHIQNAIYYICGSPTMVTTLQETLVEMGVAEEKICVEDFPGY